MRPSLPPVSTVGVPPATGIVCSVSASAVPCSYAIRLPSGLKDGWPSKLPCDGSSSLATRVAPLPSAATVSIWIGSPCPLQPELSTL